MSERLSVIVGCMFSGKTAELLRQVERSKIAKIPSQVFKPDIDNRWGKNRQVASHNGLECEAIPIPIKHPGVLFERLNPDTEHVAIDEVQFFDPEIINVVKKLLLKNIQVLVAGLPNDFRGEPFGAMPILLALADEITRLTAICTFEDENGKICGQAATRTQRLINGQPAKYSDPIVLIGASDSYAARCIKHHLVPEKPEI